MPSRVEPSRGPWIQTYTGRAFYLLDPRAEDVDPVDVAHALSLICRYGGHSKRFFSVAEHCILMSYAVAPANAPWALWHDASEAYVGDMTRPLKYALPEYRAVEARVMTAICDRVGLGYDCPDEVKAADRQIMLDEHRALMNRSQLPWTSLENVQALGVQIQCWPPAEAERRYLDRMAELELQLLRSAPAGGAEQA